MTIRRYFLRLLTAGLIAIAGTAAIAQQPRASGASADELLSTSQDMLRRIDDGDGIAVWSASAPFVRASFSQDDYASGILQARKRVGTIRARDWISVVRIRQPGGNAVVPAGLYGSVEFSTQTESGAVVLEKLSFKLEANGWRLTGYSPRDMP